MFTFSKSFTFILILTVAIFQLANSRRRQSDANFCKVSSATRCVENQIARISDGSNLTIRQLTVIENIIIATEKQIYAFNRTVYLVEQYIASRLPLDYYSEKFIQNMNIDENELIQLLEEHHTALNFYYGFIQELLSFSVEPSFRSDIYIKLKSINPILTEDVICNYRLLIRVYSNNRRFPSHIAERLFEGISQNEAPSVVYNAYSIVASRNLKQWLSRTIMLMDNLKWKEF